MQFLIHSDHLLRMNEQVDSVLYSTLNGHYLPEFLALQMVFQFSRSLR
jgi:hypothetical protein